MTEDDKTQSIALLGVRVAEAARAARAVGLDNMVVLQTIVFTAAALIAMEAKPPTEEDLDNFGALARELAKRAVDEMARQRGKRGGAPS